MRVTPFWFTSRFAYSLSAMSALWALAVVVGRRPGSLKIN